MLEEEDLIQWEFAEPEDEDEDIRLEMADQTETGGGASDPAAIGHHGHTQLFEEVVASIREDRPSTLDGREGRRSVEVIQAIYESAKTGQIVQLS